MGYESKVKSQEQQLKDAAMFPGEATDIADDEKVTMDMVDEETKELNNNPNNQGRIV